MGKIIHSGPLLQHRVQLACAAKRIASEASNFSVRVLRRQEELATSQKERKNGNPYFSRRWLGGRAGSGLASLSAPRTVCLQRSLLMHLLSK